MRELDYGERDLLRSCPRAFQTHPRSRQSPEELAALKRVQRLQALGLIRGKVTQGRAGDPVTLLITRTPAGDAVLFGPRS